MADLKQGLGLVVGRFWFSTAHHLVESANLSFATKLLNLSLQAAHTHHNYKGACGT